MDILEAYDKLLEIQKDANGVIDSSLHVHASKSTYSNETRVRYSVTIYRRGDYARIECTEHNIDDCLLRVRMIIDTENAMTKEPGNIEV